jgi:hypothetical protein
VTKETLYGKKKSIEKKKPARGFVFSKAIRLNTPFASERLKTIAFKSLLDVKTSSRRDDTCLERLANRALVRIGKR